MWREHEIRDRRSDFRQCLCLLLLGDPAIGHSLGELLVDGANQGVDQGVSAGALVLREVGQRLTLGERRDDIAAVHIEKIERCLPQQPPQTVEVTPDLVTRVVLVEHCVVDGLGGTLHEAGSLLLRGVTAGHRLVDLVLCLGDERRRQIVSTGALLGCQVGKGAAGRQGGYDLTTVHTEDLHRVGEYPSGEVTPSWTVGSGIGLTGGGRGVALLGSGGGCSKEETSDDQKADCGPAKTVALAHVCTPCHWRFVPIPEDRHEVFEDCEALVRVWRMLLSALDPAEDSGKLSRLRFGLRIGLPKQLPMSWEPDISRALRDKAALRQWTRRAKAWMGHPVLDNHKWHFLALGLVLVVAVPWGLRAEEHALEDSTVQALSAAGIAVADVSFNGRDAVISAPASSLTNIEAALGGVTGVRNIKLLATELPAFLTPSTPTPVASATTMTTTRAPATTTTSTTVPPRASLVITVGNSVKISGTLPDAATIATLTRGAEFLYGSLMTNDLLADGAVPTPVWLESGG